jgi:type I restriction enzyme S subunit
MSQPSVVEFAHHASKGVELPRVSWTSLATYPIALPPLAEQQRIADRLAAIDTRHAAAALHLAAARAVVERFRSSVLAAACSGRLTEDVRAGEATEAGSDLPTSWLSTTLGDLADSIRGGSSEVPIDTATDYPVLRSSSVRPFKIDYDDVRFLSGTQSQNVANFLKDGDLLVTRLSGSIEYVGNAALVDDIGDRRCQYPDRLFRVRLEEPEHARYVELFLASTRARAQIEAASRSAAGHQRISISDLKGLSIELPPIEEQHEIVRRSNTMLATADGFASQIDRTAATLDRVSRASLGMAFRGELVPTEAALAEEEGRDFESANELLARTATAAPKGTPRRRSKQPV